MKKLLIVVLAVCMLLSMAACGTNNAPAGTVGGNNGGSETTTPSVPAEDDFIFEYKGTKISFHAPAAPIVAALGEPVKYTESTSCAFEGLDKSYYYGSFYLETYPKGEEDFVYGWWFADDSVATEEGIYIGATQAEVEKAYGTECYNGTNAFVVNKDAGSLTVILEDGLVSSIQYAIKVD